MAKSNFQLPLQQWGLLAGFRAGGGDSGGGGGDSCGDGGGGDSCGGGGGGGGSKYLFAVLKEGEGAVTRVWC